MLSDRGSFSCFFRHSTEAAPSFLYEVLGNANIYEVPKNENPNLLRKAGWGNYDRFRFHQKISECELEWILLESIEYSA